MVFAPKASSIGWKSRDVPLPHTTTTHSSISESDKNPSPSKRIKRKKSKSRTNLESLLTVPPAENQGHLANFIDITSSSSPTNSTNFPPEGKPSSSSTHVTNSSIHENVQLHTNEFKHLEELPSLQPVYENELSHVDPIRYQGLMAILHFSPKNETVYPICITGRAYISVLQGAIEILGYHLNATNPIQRIPIESPSWMSHLCIRPCISATNSLQNPIIVHIESMKQTTTNTPQDNVLTFQLYPMSSSKIKGVSAIQISDRWNQAANLILQDTITNISTHPIVSSPCPSESKEPSMSNPTINIQEDQDEEISHDMLSTQLTFEKDSTSSTHFHSRNKTNITTETSSLVSKTRILICGAKNVGKSTYVRYLIHRLLSTCTTVAVLDCDVGQGEFSPPGLLTLTLVSQPILSPPCAHLICKDDDETDNNTFATRTTLHHAETYFYGHTSSKIDPVSYISSIHNLIQHYDTLYRQRQESSNKDIFPLVINTDGWVKGMGYEILSSIIDTTCPTHIVQMIGSTSMKFFDLTPHAYPGRTIMLVEALGMSMILSKLNIRPGVDDENDDGDGGFFLSHVEPEDDKVLVEEGTQSESKAYISSQHLRSLRLCTYFLGGYDAFLSTGAELKSTGVWDENCIIAKSLARMKPYMIPIDALRFIFCHGPNISKCIEEEKVHRDDVLFDILNGSVVALCTLDYRQKDTPPNGSHCPCSGLGIIRSIDREKRILYLLTPISLRTLQSKVDTIVHGSIQLPIACLYCGADSESFPYQCLDKVPRG